MKQSIFHFLTIRTGTSSFTTSARILSNMPKTGYQSSDKSEKQTGKGTQSQLQTGQNIQKDDCGTTAGVPGTQEKAEKQKNQKGWDPETERNRGEGIATD
jgi:hypothetical protein